MSMRKFLKIIQLKNEFIFETFEDIRCHLNDEEAADEDEDESDVKKYEKKGERKETDTGQGS